jgi:hypothetical protein
MRLGAAMALALVACGHPSATPDGPAAPDGASADASPPDAAPAVIDAMPDAPTDAAPDATPPDAGPPDFDVQLVAGPTLFSNGLPIHIHAIVTNHDAVFHNATVTLTGPFAIGPGGACGNLGPLGACEIDIIVVGQSLGLQTGTLTVTIESSTSPAIPLAVQVEAHVGVGTITGPGTVTVSPPADPGCGNTGCYAVGTIVTLTQTPTAGATFWEWGIPSCGKAPTCTVVAAATPTFVDAWFFAAPATLSITFVGGPGEVSVLEPLYHYYGSCTGSCTMTIDSAQPLTVMASTPVEFGGLNGANATGDGGFQEDFPAGTTAITGEFDREPGEVDLPGTDVAFDASNDTAIVDGGTVTVRDPSLAVKWSVPGAHVAFAPSGALYVDDGAGTTREYDAAGNLVAQQAMPLGTVTPSGGRLVGSGNNLYVYDASMTLVRTLALSGTYGGCAGEDDRAATPNITAAVTTSTSELSYDKFALDGTYLSTYDSNHFVCKARPDWHGGVVWSSEHPQEFVVTHDGFYVDDLAAGWVGDPYDAGADAADHVTWMRERADHDPVTGLWMLWYTPPSTTPTRTFTRNIGQNVNAGDVGITPQKLAVSPDGHVAVVATWYGAMLGGSWVEIFPPQ